MGFSFWDAKLSEKDLKDVEETMSMFYKNDPEEVRWREETRLLKEKIVMTRLKQLGYILLFVFFIHLISR